MNYSFRWLNDPEIKKLTLTPDIDQTQQIAWFESLESRTDYLIRGILADGRPIGAVGIKKIDRSKSQGEYWGYIGEKDFIGKGIGKHLLSAMFAEAEKIGLKRLVLHVAEYNERAYQLYLKHGFREAERQDGILTMEKIL